MKDKWTRHLNFAQDFFFWEFFVGWFVCFFVFGECPVSETPSRTPDIHTLENPKGNTPSSMIMDYVEKCRPTGIKLVTGGTDFPIVETHLDVRFSPGYRPGCRHVHWGGEPSGPPSSRTTNIRPFRILRIVYHDPSLVLFRSLCERTPCFNFPNRLFEIGGSKMIKCSKRNYNDKIRYEIFCYVF